MKTYKVTIDGTKRWYNAKDQFHREDGPAVEYNDGTKAWYIKGQLHREDGPAIEWSGGSKEWYINGQLHREDGPAVEWSDGTKEWWLNGKQLTKAEWLKLSKNREKDYILFSKIRKRIKNENNDCTVMALSICTGQTYRKTHKFLENLGRKFGEGFDLNYNKLKNHFYLYPAYTKFKNKKVKTFINNNPNYHDNILIITKNHCLVIKKGKIYDDRDSSNLLIDEILCF